MKEIYKTIPSHPDYKISNFGNVISYKGKEPRQKAISNYSNGYQFVTLENNKSYLIHRLVMETFCPIENMKEMEVNHKDCNRQNNYLENLEWVTPQQNREYRDTLKHTPKAESIQVTFLTGEEMVFDSMTACAKYFGVTRKAINRYLETDNIRSDRKVQAYFRRLGRTYDLNK